MQTINNESQTTGITLDYNRYEPLMKNTNDGLFFQRMWSTPQRTYINRLKAIGFEGKDNVLDAGCGFGQWAVAMAQLNKNVSAIDHFQNRVDTVNAIAKDLELPNIKAVRDSLVQIPFEDDTFDAIFSYGVILELDYRQALKEFYRVLKPGGICYFTVNDLGWFIYNLLDGHNECDGFSSQDMAIEAIRNTMQYYATGVHTQGSSIIMPFDIVKQDLQELGFELLKEGPDGSINKNPQQIEVKAFFGI